jgi:hypothetical protein
VCNSAWKIQSLTLFQQLERTGSDPLQSSWKASFQQRLAKGNIGDARLGPRPR